MCLKLYADCNTCCLLRPCTLAYGISVVISLILWITTIVVFIFAIFYLTWNTATCLVDHTDMTVNLCETCDKGHCDYYDCNMQTAYFTVWYNQKIFNSSLTQDNPFNLPDGKFTCCTNSTAVDVIESDCDHLMYEILIALLAVCAVIATVLAILISYRIIRCHKDDKSAILPDTMPTDDASAAYI